MNDQQFCSLSSPDDSKVGIDLNLTVASIMNNTIKQVAVCMGQVAFGRIEVSRRHSGDVLEAFGDVPATFR